MKESLFGAIVAGFSLLNLNEPTSESFGGDTESGSDTKETLTRVEVCYSRPSEQPPPFTSGDNYRVSTYAVLPKNEELKNLGENPSLIKRKN